MTYTEIQDLLKLINKSDLAEFKLRDNDFKLTIKTKKFFPKKGKTVVTQSPSYAPIPTVLPSISNPPTQVHTNPHIPTSQQEKLDPSTDKKVEQPTSATKTIEIKSPMVGTFYRSSSPDKPPFVKVGDKISAGDRICIIEAMKLFNEIESEFTGTVIKVLVEDSNPVEYDQPLFLLEV